MRSLQSSPKFLTLPVVLSHLLQFMPIMYIPRQVVLVVFTYLVCATALKRDLAAADSSSVQSVKRSSMTRFLVVGGNIGRDSAYWCDSTEVAAIDHAISWMRKYAAAAYNFLLEEDSHTTAAYIAWFGADNAFRSTARDIMRNVYDSIWDLGEESDGFIDEMEAREGAVVLGCPTLSTEPECGNARAIASSSLGYVQLCPQFFAEGPGPQREEWSLSEWRSRRYALQTAGRTMLHEMTHMEGVVGAYETDDVVSASQTLQCINLDDSDMLRNAENYALFALEVKADHSNAAQQVDMDSDEAKWKIARRLLRASAGGAQEC